MFAIDQTLKSLKEYGVENKPTIDTLKDQYKAIYRNLDGNNKEIIENWESKVKSYQAKYFVFKVRGKEFKLATHTESLSHLQIPKISLPKYKDWGEILKWNLRENVPGFFLLKEKEKIQQGCLREKVAQKGPISAFIMFPWECLQNGFLLHLIR